MERFLEDLFGDEVTPERRIAVFTTPGQHVRFFHDSGQLGLYARQRSPTHNVYFGVGLVRGEPKGRGKYQDIAGIGALWCDIDIHGPAHSRQNLPGSREEAEGLLGQMPLAPSIIVDSGHGLHAYWMLHEPWIFATDDERAAAQSLAKRWHGKVCALAAKKGWPLENLGDVTRVLRLPGTLNHNGPGDPIEVRILESEPNRRYAPDDFEPFLPDGEDKSAFSDVQVDALVLRADAEPPAARLLETASQSPLFWQTWNRQRADLPDQSQSGYDLSLATIAVLRGWNDQDIDNLIIAARRHHHDRPQKALREDYIRRTIAKARQTVQLKTAEAEAVDLSGMVGAPTPDPEEPARPDPPCPGPFPVELIQQAPDIVRRCMDYYLDNAVEVQPVLFLGSIIAATGTVLGHKVKDASGLRTNIYALGISPSGGGKEATWEVVFKIFRHAGIGPMCGEEDFASDAGLISAIEKQNPILFQLDEFARFMHAIKVGGAKCPHLYNIASMLLKLYSKAGSVFRSKAYADAKRNKEINQPHVCMYGTTVGTSFWRSMDTDSLEGGYLPRLLIFESKDDPDSGGEVESDPPGELTEFFAFWANRRLTPGNLEPVHPQPMIVPYTTEAKGLMDDLRSLQRAEKKRHGVLGTLWSRARENAGKVALIHACWKDREDPVVDADSAHWAIDLVVYAVRHTLYEANLCMSEGAFHERCQVIMRAIEHAKNRELSRRDLTRATRNMTPREREEAISTLVEQGRLNMRLETTGGRPATWYGAP